MLIRFVLVGSVVLSTRQGSSAQSKYLHLNAMKTASPVSARSLFHRLVLGLVITAGLSLPAQATDVSTLKLNGRWTGNASGYVLGGGELGDSPAQPIAANETWIIAGARSADEQATNQGAVQVFKASTGAWVRKLLPPAPATAGTQFGYCCAVSGNTAVISSPAPLASSTGVAYVYDLTNGKLLRTLKPNPGDGTVGDFFGASVAISGNRVLIGALQEDLGTGSAYIFDLNTGAQLFKKQEAGINANEFYGFSVAAEGNIGVVGCIYADGGRGAAYAYDLTTGALIKKYQAGASVVGDGCYSVAITQGKVIIGAAFANANAGKVFVMDMLTSAEVTLTATDAGAGDVFGFNLAAHQGMLLVGSLAHSNGRDTCWVYDLNSAATTEMMQLHPPDVQTGIRFGANTAWSGNTAVIAAPDDSPLINNVQTTAAGSIYLMRPITRPMPLTKVAAKGDSAPGAAETNFNLWKDAYLNRDGAIAFASSLTGFGSNRNKDTGVWNTLATGNPLDLSLKSRQVDGAVSILSVSKPLINRQTNSIFQAMLTGTGVSSLDNLAIYKDDGTAVTRILRTGGAASALFGGGVPKGFTAVTQSRNLNRIATTFTLRSGVASTTTANDTGLLLFDYGTSLGEVTAPREGSAAAATGLTYGQFTGRIAYFHDVALYTTAVAGPPASNQAIFRKFYNVPETVLAQKGDIPPAPGGAPFSSFIGEAADDGPKMVYRATLGAPATSANNEGLWLGPTATSTLVMRKGVDLAPALPGLRIARFISFWPTFDQVAALVQLAGPGVNSSNDQALLLYQTLNLTGITVLMREGEPASGCNGATIGVISRVELEPYYGQYLVLATLKGAPAGTDQALFRGLTHKGLTGVDQQTLRRPVPVLRKGTLFNNQPSKIKSLSLPTTNLTAAGAGTTGLGRAMRENVDSVNPREIALTVTFDNGVVQLMKGIP